MSVAPTNSRYCSDGVGTRGTQTQVTGGAKSSALLPWLLMNGEDLLPLLVAASEADVTAPSPDAACASAEEPVGPPAKRARQDNWSISMENEFLKSVKHFGFNWEKVKEDLVVQKHHTELASLSVEQLRKKYKNLPTKYKNNYKRTAFRPKKSDCKNMTKSERVAAEARHAEAENQNEVLWKENQVLYETVEGRRSNLI
jgi:hypothetical protein